jgi:hypothetical protein
MALTAEQKISRNAINASLRSQGRCLNCGEKTEGGYLCSACAKVDRIRRAQHRQQLVEQGLCIRCGKRPHAKYITLCQECSDYGVQYKRITRGDRVITLSQKRTCSGCRALYQSQYMDRCELGYKFNGNFKPLEPCPKPRTNSDFIECCKFYKK